jgi:hypothetical protein
MVRAGPELPHLAPVQHLVLVQLLQLAQGPEQLFSLKIGHMPEDGLAAPYLESSIGAELVGTQGKFCKVSEKTRRFLARNRPLDRRFPYFLCIDDERCCCYTTRCRV